MRIGFLIDRWEPNRGGAEKALARFAFHLQQQGHQILAFGAHGPTAPESAPGIFHRVKARGLTRSARELSLGRALVAAASEHLCEKTIGIRHLPKVDFFWPHGGSHLTTWQAIRQARGQKASGNPRGRHRTFISMEKQLMTGGGAGQIICISELVQQELEDLYPACRKRLHLVPNGIDLERFQIAARDNEGLQLRHTLGLAPDMPLLTFIAANPQLKGLPALTRALANITDRKWHLLVAGAPKSRCASDLRHLPGTKVTHLQQASGLALAAAADLLVLPVWREPCGLAILEALACGTPVITTTRAGAATWITTDLHGRALTDPGDHDTLATTINDYLARPPLTSTERIQIRKAVIGLSENTWLQGLEAVLFSRED